jgi:hypothetical protein
MSTLSTSDGATAASANTGALSGQPGTFWGVPYVSVVYGYGPGGGLDQVTYFDAANNVLASQTIQSDGSYSVNLDAGGSFWGENYATVNLAFSSGGALENETFYDAASKVVALQSTLSDGSYSVRLDAGGSFWGENYDTANFAVSSGGALENATFYDAASNVVASQTTLSDGSHSVNLDAGGSFWGVNYATLNFVVSSGGTLENAIFYDAASNVVASQSTLSDGSYNVILDAAGMIAGTNYASADYGYTASGVLDQV